MTSVEPSVASRATKASHSLASVWATGVAALLAIGLGSAAVFAPRSLLIVLASVMVIAITATLTFRTRTGFDSTATTTTLGQIMFVLVGLGILLVTFNAIRPVSGATVSDLAFFLALLTGGIACLDSSWKPPMVAPPWLLAAGVLLLIAALLVGIFPARPSQAALLFPGGPLSGMTPSIPTPSNGGVAIRLVGALVFLPAIIALSANSPQRIRILGEVWVAGVAVNGVVAILQYLGLITIGDSIYGGDLAADNRVYGLTNHVNALGLVSAMALPLAASHLGSTRGWKRYYYTAVVASMLAGIALSGSRAAVLGGLLGLLVVAVLHRGGRRGFIRSAGVAAVLTLVAGVALSPLPATERLFGGSDPLVTFSDQQRESIYPAVWQEVTQRPIVGHGFEYVRGAHNIYLQLLHAGGVIALAGFLTFAVGLTMIGLREADNRQLPDDLRNIASSSVASLAVWLLVGGLVGTAIFDRYLYIPVGLIIAISSLMKPRSAVQPQASVNVFGTRSLEPRRPVSSRRFNPIPQQSPDSA